MKYLPIALAAIIGLSAILSSCAPPRSERMRKELQNKKKAQQERGEKARQNSPNDNGNNNTQGNNNGQNQPKRVPKGNQTTPAQMKLFNQAKTKRDEAQKAYNGGNHKQAKKLAHEGMQFLYKLQELNEEYSGLNNMMQELIALSRGKN